MPPILTPELVDHYCRNEWAMRLDDILERRTKWAQFGIEDTDMIGEVAQWMGQSLGWEDNRWKLERDYYMTMHTGLVPEAKDG